MKAKIAFLVFLIVLTLPILVSAASGDLLREAPKPSIELPESGECVKDTAYMRANHMKVLMEERVRAVRDGERTAEHSLKNCFSCHTNKEKFCDECHQYAGVKPGCFSNVGGCHYPGPASE